MIEMEYILHSLFLKNGNGIFRYSDKEEVITYFSHADTTAFSSGLELRMADQPESPSWPPAPVLLLSPGPCCCCGGGCCCGGENTASMSNTWLGDCGSSCGCTVTVMLSWRKALKLNV